MLAAVPGCDVPTLAALDFSLHSQICDQNKFCSGFGTKGYRLCTDDSSVAAVAPLSMRMPCTRGGRADVSITSLAFHPLWECIVVGMSDNSFSILG